eukprot:SAG31_NODE_14268_length_817_cov_1.651811_1_plen_158_part_10
MLHLLAALGDSPRGWILCDFIIKFVPKPGQPVLKFLLPGNPIICGFLALGFFGLDQVGAELEGPYGVDDNDLPLLAIGVSLGEDLDAMLRTVSRDRLMRRSYSRFREGVFEFGCIPIRQCGLTNPHSCVGSMLKSAAQVLRWNEPATVDERSSYSLTE